MAKSKLPRVLTVALIAVAALALSGVAAQAAPVKPPPHQPAAVRTQTQGSTVQPNGNIVTCSYASLKPFLIGSAVWGEATYECGPGPDMPDIFSGYLKLWGKNGANGTPQLQNTHALTRPSIPNEEYSTNTMGIGCKHGWYYWDEFYVDWHWIYWTTRNFNSPNAIGLC